MRRRKRDTVDSSSPDWDVLAETLDDHILASQETADSDSAPQLQEGVGDGSRRPESASGDGFSDFSITVTGAALETILAHRKLLVSFYTLAYYADVVIACRVTPKQKALLVEQATALNPRCASTVAIGKAGGGREVTTS